MPNDTERKPAERPPRTSEPEKGTRLSAVEIHDNILAGASEDLERPTASLFWSALASGAVIGFSFLASAFLSSLATGEPHKHALAAAGYPLGFIFVVVGRLELFTENTLEPVLPLLHERTMERLRGLLRLWVVLLVGNLIGALVFGLLIARTPMVNPELHAELTSISRSAVEGGPWLVFYRGIYAGWLIAGLSWLLGATTARGAQIVLIWLVTATIQAFHFRHSIAGAVEAFYLAFRGGVTWNDVVAGFLFPAIVGNAVGGVVLVALLNYAQVMQELEPEPHTRE